jgi:hypothetical protein
MILTFVEYRLRDDDSHIITLHRATHWGHCTIAIFLVSFCWMQHTSLLVVHTNPWSLLCKFSLGNLFRGVVVKPWFICCNQPNNENISVLTVNHKQLTVLLHPHLLLFWCQVPWHSVWRFLCQASHGKWVLVSVPHPCKVSLPTMAYRAVSTSWGIRTGLLHPSGT